MEMSFGEAACLALRQEMTRDAQATGTPRGRTRQTRMRPARVEPAPAAGA